MAYMGYGGVGGSVGNGLFFYHSYIDVACRGKHQIMILSGRGAQVCVEQAKRNQQSKAEQSRAGIYMGYFCYLLDIEIKRGSLLVFCAASLW